MRKAATAIVVALALLMSVQPAPGCCMAKPMKVASMHASMPCCGPTCKMTKAAPVRDRDVALLPSASFDAPIAIATVTAFTEAPPATTRIAVYEGERADLGPPPALPLPLRI